MYKPITPSIDYTVRKVLLKMIKIYQYIISPYIGNACRFYPSCSCYAKIAFKRFNIVKAIYLTIFRLLKCHPFHLGGVNLVPENNKKLM
ncbi:membrane protein insertion efficiency factor YidD [Coxiella endosymbiont of Dermacentor marginatus]|uniref:membrane protein insertion efficiency factor YidD n=1 Tax=Coxiella endosymbiont of Dermacentor marginatus TaxID=1656159 RepID=UPI002221324D|nr:membrane protein insertion efficiency factor YidD [Coxiella endosymbiont of Dermacentor marginatus]